MTNWIQTFTGTKFPISLDRAELLSAIKLEDICRHLSLINRFNGATTRPVSVAQHSLAVAALVPMESSIRLQALLHDAVEAYVGDIPRPLRKLLGKAWTNYELAIDGAIKTKFGLPPNTNSAIARADEVILFLEKRLYLLNQLDWGWEPEAWETQLVKCNQDYMSPYGLNPAQANRVLFDEVQACL